MNMNEFSVLSQLSIEGNVLGVSNLDLCSRLESLRKVLNSYKNSQNFGSLIFHEMFNSLVTLHELRI